MPNEYGLSPVVDPRQAAAEVTHPAAQWEGEGEVEGAQWIAKVVGGPGKRQVELRPLRSDVRAVVRLNLGGPVLRDGKPLDASLTISMNKMLRLKYRDYYALLSAIDEAIARLITVQETDYAEAVQQG